MHKQSKCVCLWPLKPRYSTTFNIGKKGHTYYCPKIAISTTNRHAELLRHIRTHLLRMWIRHLYRHPPMVRQAQGTYLFLAKKYRAMEGGLTTCRIAKRFCNPEKNPRKDFFSGKLRMTAHSTFDKPAFAGRLIKGIPVA